MRAFHDPARPTALRPPIWPAIPALAWVLALALGCAEPPPSDAVARVGGDWVRMERFDLYLDHTAGIEAGELSSEVLSKILDGFLEEELLTRLAVERGVAQPDDPHRYAIERLLASEAESEPTREEIEGYYREHRPDYRRLERVRLRQILVEDRDTVERAMTELRGGTDFAEAARRFSRDSTGETGGIQGELARDDLPPVFAETIFALEPGEISRILEAEYGFHIFQVTERLPAEVLPLELVEDEIREQLLEEAADRHLDRLVEEARNRYPVEVYTHNLPFDYRGSFDEEQT